MIQKRRISLQTQIHLLLSGSLNQIGWAMAGFGMIFVIVFGSMTDFSFINFTGKETIETEGLIESVEKTGSEINAQAVRAYSYTFRDIHGNSKSSVSYLEGNRGLKEGDKIIVEYPENSPNKARIHGMRGKPFSPIVLLVLIFPFIGFVFIFFGIKKGIQIISIARHGLVAEGIRTDRKKTNIEINEEPVYEISLLFTARDGNRYTCRAKTHKTHLLEDNDREQILYDSRNPQRAVPLDTIPGKPAIKENGEIESASFYSTAVLLIVPLLSIAINICIVVYVF